MTFLYLNSDQMDTGEPEPGRTLMGSCFGHTHSCRGPRDPQHTLTTMMKTIPFLLGLALAMSASAQRASMPDDQRPSPEQLLKTFDRNGDGKLSRDEAPERMKQRWDQIDTNHDGFITVDELKARDARVAGADNKSDQTAGPQPTAAPTAVPGVTEGTRAYVNAAHATGNHDGKSWASAFATVQEALASGAAEIWVAAGTYTPGTGRNATFQLRQGGSLYGGFAGTETRRDPRDWRKNTTILKGDGAAHVVTGADDAVLDGFTITGGNAMGGEALGMPGGGPATGRQPAGAPAAGGPPAGGGGGRAIHMTPQSIMGGSNSGSGAGMLNFHASPIVRNCIFENNQAGKGGGVYNMTSTTFPPRPDANSKAPVFINCVFRNNMARGRGAGVSNDLGTSPTFLNCVFEGNETPQKGGGMYNDFGCSPTLVNCLFDSNKAQSAGGMGNDGGSSPVIYLCSFTKNHAEDYGAPLYQGTGPASNPALIGCVIQNNTCDWEDPGIYNWHDNTPVVKPSPIGESGYQAGRFTEAQLPQLLNDLKAYRPQPVREPLASAPEKIPNSQRIVFVNASATGNGDGRAWSSAYPSLIAALDDAGKDGAEVRVAAGKYQAGPDRAASFVLHPGVRVLGGFAGNDSPRDPVKNVTVLDGNHAYHVLTGANGAVLDGLTITGGCADGSGYDGKGGGLINYRRGPQSRPNSDGVTGFAMTINRCVFSNNSARDGGAVYSYDRAKPVFTGCVFTGNRAENGGAVLDRVGVESTFTKCEFTGNTGHWRGGAVYFDYGSRPKLNDCVFRNNSTEGHGGAAFSVSRASQLENTIVSLDGCRFEGNTAKGKGGAAAFCDSSISSVKNCVYAGNKAGKEGNDVFIDSSSSNSADAGAAPAAAGIGARSAPPQDSTDTGGRPAGRTGGENLPTHFQPGGDFSVILLGTGGPPYNPKRSGPSAAIQYHGRFLLVDMGNGTQARLYEAGISSALIDALLLTHHHRDHDEEFMPILNGALVRGLPVEIVGPPGTRKLADFTREFYAEDIAYRIERMGRSAQNIRQPNVREIQGGESFKLGDLQVKTVQVPHTIHTVAYRFDVGGQSIVISGDLTYSDKLIELARDADVLVIDSGAAVTGPNSRRPAAAIAPGGTGQPTAHASMEDVANMARKSAAKQLVLTHIVPVEVDEKATEHAIGTIYQGKTIVGHDLLEIVPGKR